MPNEHLIETIRAAIERAALGIEILGALVIFAGVLRVPERKPLDVSWR